MLNKCYLDEFIKIAQKNSRGVQAGEKFCGDVVNAAISRGEFQANKIRPRQGHTVISNRLCHEHMICWRHGIRYVLLQSKNPAETGLFDW